MTHSRVTPLSVIFGMLPLAALGLDSETIQGFETIVPFEATLQAIEAMQRASGSPDTITRALGLVLQDVLLGTEGCAGTLRRTGSLLSCVRSLTACLICRLEEESERLTGGLLGALLEKDVVVVELHTDKFELYGWAASAEKLLQREKTQMWRYSEEKLNLVGLLDASIKSLMDDPNWRFPMNTGPIPFWSIHRTMNLVVYGTLSRDAVTQQLALALEVLFLCAYMTLTDYPNRHRTSVSNAYEALCAALQWRLEEERDDAFPTTDKHLAFGVKFENGRIIR